MKKIINGRMYNTETAKELGSRYWNNPTPTWRTIYKKKTGEYFLLEESRNGTTWEPLTEEEAKAIAEEYITADEYEAVFGKVEE